MKASFLVKLPLSEYKQDSTRRGNPQPPTPTEMPGQPKGEPNYTPLYDNLNQDPAAQHHHTDFPCDSDCIGRFY